VLKFPSDDIVPLVQLERKVSVRLDLAGKVRIHGGFTGGTDGNRLLEVRFAALGDPCYLGSETFEMLLFTLEIVGADEDRKVGIADFDGLADVSRAD
jgi:hypothetical protein